MNQAKIRIDDAVLDGFYKAQGSRNVRFLKLTLDETMENLTLERTVNYEGSPEQDFTQITSQFILTENEAAYLLFCTQDYQSGLRPDRLPWVLITWIPNGERIKERMLLSANIRQLQTALDVRSFVMEYPASSLEHLSWASFARIFKGKAFDELLLTPSELGTRTAQRKINRGDMMEGTRLLGVLSTRVSPEVHTAWNVQHKSDKGRWVDMAIMSEEVSVETLIVHQQRGFDDAMPPISELFCADEPRYVLVKLPSKGAGSATVVVFALTCPVSAPVDAKMLYAASKSSVVQELALCNIAIDASVEAGSAAELEEALILAATTYSRGTQAEPGANKASLLLGAKPRIPGKLRKPTKFVLPLPQ